MAILITSVQNHQHYKDLCGVFSFYIYYVLYNGNRTIIMVHAVWLVSFPKEYLFYFILSQHGKDCGTHCFVLDHFMPLSDSLTGFSLRD